MVQYCYCFNEALFDEPTKQQQRQPLSLSQQSTTTCDLSGCCNKIISPSSTPRDYCCHDHALQGNQQLGGFIDADECVQCTKQAKRVDGDDRQEVDRNHGTIRNIILRMIKRNRKNKVSPLNR